MKASATRSILPCSAFEFGCPRVHAEVDAMIALKEVVGTPTRGGREMVAAAGPCQPLSQAMQPTGARAACSS